MTPIRIDPYLYNRIKRRFSQEPFTAHGYQLVKRKADWYLSWGRPRNRGPEALVETGFFWGAMHIDRAGLYQHSAFNTPAGRDQFLSYQPERSAKDIVFGMGLPKSKYKQRGVDARWDGVVLALQRPKDRSIRAVGTAEDYYAFVEGACKHYGKHLFLKEHPAGRSERRRWKNIAKEYGCAFGKVNHSVTKNCKFVILYNSTFAVDCFLRNVPVMQFAPGYFYKTGAVTYTDREYWDACTDCGDVPDKLVDFTIWRYCLWRPMIDSEWVEVIARFIETDDLFPITERMSYAEKAKV